MIGGNFNNRERDWSTTVFESVELSQKLGRPIVIKFAVSSMRSPYCINDMRNMHLLEKRVKEILPLESQEVIKVNKTHFAGYWIGSNEEGESVYISCSIMDQIQNSKSMWNDSMRQGIRSTGELRDEHIKQTWSAKFFEMQTKFNSKEIDQEQYTLFLEEYNQVRDKSLIYDRISDHSKKYLSLTVRADAKFEAEMYPLFAKALSIESGYYEDIVFQLRNKGIPVTDFRGGNILEERDFQTGEVIRYHIFDQMYTGLADSQHTLQREMDRISKLNNFTIMLLFDKRDDDMMSFITSGLSGNEKYCVELNNPSYSEDHGQKINEIEFENEPEYLPLQYLFASLIGKRNKESIVKDSACSQLLELCTESMNNAPEKYYELTVNYLKDYIVAINAVRATADLQPISNNIINELISLVGNFKDELISFGLVNEQDFTKLNGQIRKACAEKMKVDDYVSADNELFIAYTYKGCFWFSYKDPKNISDKLSQLPSVLRFREIISNMPESFFTGLSPEDLRAAQSTNETSSEHGILKNLLSEVLSSDQLSRNVDNSLIQYWFSTVMKDLVFLEYKPVKKIKEDSVDLLYDCFYDMTHFC